jgi:NADPH:quinone reductase-like Zn-dependent oxidoreductase
VPGDSVDGYARERVVRPARWFTRAPERYNHAEAATLTTAGLTAWRALVSDGPLTAGETVLILGTGGVSIFALQFAKMMGAATIVTSSSDEKLARARALGADHTINYRQQPKWAEDVLGRTDGRGVDHVIEVGGPDTLPQSISACRIGGHIAFIGVLTGFAGRIPTVALLTRQARLQGLQVGSRQQQIEMIRALDANDIKPVIDKTFPLHDLSEAFLYEAACAHFGKICIEM